MSFPDRYIFWNYVLTEYCLLSNTIDGQALLTVTPHILSYALLAAGESRFSPQEAETDFKAAVAEAYQSVVLSSSDKLGAFARRDHGDPPLSVSYLALSVLAAYNMRTDIEYTGRAYYPRLASLLDCGMAGMHPVGFDGAKFEYLWRHLADWLRTDHQRRLALPRRSGVHRYLQYPLAHIPLRQVDIERLPNFFDTRGYEPAHALASKPQPDHNVLKNKQQLAAIENDHNIDSTPKPQPNDKNPHKFHANSMPAACAASRDC